MGKTLASRKKSADSRLLTGCKNMLNKRNLLSSSNSLSPAPPFLRQRTAPPFPFRDWCHSLYSGSLLLGPNGVRPVSCNSHSCQGTVRGFVSRFAGLDSEVTYWNLTVPFICSSWTWWYFMSRCFDFCRTTPKVINLMAPWLSHPIGAGPSTIFTAIPPPTSFIIHLSQRLSRVACEKAIYLSSSIESATTLWDLACQYIKPDMTRSLLKLTFPSPNTYPPTDYRVVRFSA